MFINKLFLNLFSAQSSLTLFSILFSLLFILIGCENEKNESSNNNDMNLLFVASEGNNVFGWATLSPVSSTWGYVGVAEVSVHVRQEKQRQGIGSALLKVLLAASEKEKYWTITAEIISENIASLILHRKCGFREVGYREKLGHRQGVWHDVILLERRSQKTGGNGLPTRKCK